MLAVIGRHDAAGLPGGASGSMAARDGSAIGATSAAIPRADADRRAVRESCATARLIFSPRFFGGLIAAAAPPLGLARFDDGFRCRSAEISPGSPHDRRSLSASSPAPTPSFYRASALERRETSTYAFFLAY